MSEEGWREGVREGVREVSCCGFRFGSGSVEYSLDPDPAC